MSSIHDLHFLQLAFVKHVQTLALERGIDFFHTFEQFDSIWLWCVAAIWWKLRMSRLHSGFRFHLQSMLHVPSPTVRAANIRTVHFDILKTFKMVNVPMLRKTFCPHPDCKGNKPFRVTNHKSLTEELTSRKRRQRLNADLMMDSRCLTTQSLWLMI